MHTLDDWLWHFDAIAWIMSNLLVGYIGVALIVFSISYYILFDPRATTGGRMVFRFTFSLIGVVGLVFISLFIDPSPGHRWNEFPGDVLWWRPLLRLAAYLYVSYTVTAMAVVLYLRKFHPKKLNTAPIDESTFVKVRRRKR